MYEIIIILLISYLNIFRLSGSVFFIMHRTAYAYDEMRSFGNNYEVFAVLTRRWIYARWSSKEFWQTTLL